MQLKNNLLYANENTLSEAVSFDLKFSILISINLPLGAKTVIPEEILIGNPATKRR